MLRVFTRGDRVMHAFFLVARAGGLIGTELHRSYTGRSSVVMAYFHAMFTALRNN